MSSNLQDNSARKDLTVGCCAVCGAGLDPNCIPGEAMSPTLRGCNLQPLDLSTSQFPFKQKTQEGTQSFIPTTKTTEMPFRTQQCLGSSYFAAHEVFSAINSLSLRRAEQFLSGRVSSYVFLTAAQSLSSFSIHQPEASAFQVSCMDIF